MSDILLSSPPLVPFKSTIKNLLDFGRKIKIYHRKLVVCSVSVYEMKRAILWNFGIFQNISGSFWNLIWCSWCPEEPGREFEPDLHTDSKRYISNLQFTFALDTNFYKHITFSFAKHLYTPTHKDTFAICNLHSNVDR